MFGAVMECIPCGSVEPPTEQRCQQSARFRGQWRSCPLRRWHLQTMRNWIRVIFWGDDYHTERRIQHYSSRGARVHIGPGRYVIRPQIQRLVHHPGKARNHDLLRPCVFKRLHAGVAGRSAGEDVIDQDDARTLDLCRFSCRDRDSTAQGPCPRLFAEPAELGCRFRADQPVEQQLRLCQPRQILRQQRGLIIPAVPQSPAVQRHRHDQPCSLHRRQPRGDQAGQHRSHRDSPTVFERQDQLTRCRIVERPGGNPVMPRRIC